MDGSVYKEPEQIVYDHQRSATLVELGVEVIRFWNSEVTDNCNDVLSRILEKIEKRTK